jgi:hypothetical protein
MAVTASLNKLLDKAYENTDLKQLRDAPVAALAGVSDSDADLLQKAFGIKTIGDLGRNKYFLDAEAITRLADASD